MISNKSVTSGSSTPVEQNQNNPNQQSNYPPRDPYQQQHYEGRQPQSPPYYDHYPPSPPHYQGPNVSVVVPKQESPTFAVITLLFYIFLYPIGLILNIIGMITGPKQGCFTQLFLLFVIVPIALFVIMLLAGIDILSSIL